MQTNTAYELGCGSEINSDDAEISVSMTGLGNDATLMLPIDNNAESYSNISDEALSEMQAMSTNF